MAQLPDISAERQATPSPNLSTVGYQTPDAGAAAAPGLAQAQLGQEMVKGADEMYAAIKVQQQKVDAVKVDAAMNKVMQKKLDLTYGPEGYQNLKGAAAVDRPAGTPTMFEQYHGDFGKAVEDIGNTLTNDDQKKMFAQHSNIARLQMQEGLLQHAVQQTAVLAKDTYDGRVAVATADSSANWQNDLAVQTNKDSVENSLKNFARAQGYDQTTEAGRNFIEALKIKDFTKINSAVIDQALASKNFIFAKEYFDKNKDYIDPTTAKAYEAKVYQADQQQAFNGYMTNYLAVHDDRQGLTKLMGDVTKDTTLDETRKLALQGKMETRLDALNTRAEVQQNKATTLVTQGIATLQKNLTDGFEPTPEQLQPLIQAATGNPLLEGQVNRLLQTADITRKFRMAGPVGQAAILNGMTAEVQAGGSPSTGQISTGTGAVNNPGNMRPGGQFASYASPEDGFAAMVKNLQGPLYLGAGKTSVSQIINTWAPPASAGGDNSQASVTNYVAAVSKALGVTADAPLDLKDPATLSKLTFAMSQFEQGSKSKFTPEQAAAGASLIAQGKEIKTAANQSRFDVTLINHLKTIQEQQKDQLKADGVTYAVRTGWVDPSSKTATPIDFTHPDKIDPETLIGRYQLATELNQRMGAPVKPLTQPEVATATSAIAGMDARAKAGFFGAMAQKWGNNNQGYMSMVAQLAPDNPVAANGGKFAGRQAQQSDIGVTPASGEAKTVAEAIFDGLDILRPKKNADGTPSNGHLWPMPTDKDMQTSFQSAAGDAYRGNPSIYNADFQTVKAIYVSLSSAAGKPGDDAGKVNSDRFTKAFQMATGGTASYNGNTVLLPWGRDESRFKDEISRRVTDLGANNALPAGMDAKQVLDLPLVQIGDGRYAFRSGDYNILGKDHQPIVVDFNQALYDFKWPEAQAPGAVKVSKAAIKPGATMGVGPGQ